MPSEVDVYNQALNLVGSRDNVASPTEPSRRAEVCRRWFGPMRDQVLCAAYWSSAKAYARLAVLAERDDSIDWDATQPQPGYRFAYGVPDDFLLPRFESEYSTFEYGIHAGSRAVFSNTESLVMFYTKQETAIGAWTHPLYMAIVHALAAQIVQPLAGKRSLARDLADHANNLITQARVTDANMDEFQTDSIPEWLAARGYTGTIPSSRFYYPLGPLVTVGIGLSAG